MSMGMAKLTIPLATVAAQVDGTAENRKANVGSVHAILISIDQCLDETSEYILIGISSRQDLARESSYPIQGSKFLRIGF